MKLVCVARGHTPFEDENDDEYEDEIKITRKPRRRD
jgi:hypothetical protein